MVLLRFGDQGFECFEIRVSSPGFEIRVSSVELRGYRTRIVVVIDAAMSAAQNPLRVGGGLDSGIGLRVEPQTMRA